jgi:FMN reductase
MKTDFLVVSCSLNPDSNSRIMARSVLLELSARGTVEWLDLQDYQLPLCDGGAAYSHPQVAEVTEKIREARCVLVAVPVYNYAVNAAAKNLIEMTGHAWNDKVVGFLCAAGGRSSYMSVLSFANSLMLDFRSLIIPRFVYAEGSAFAEGQIVDVVVLERIEELAETAAGMLGCTAIAV